MEISKIYKYKSNPIVGNNLSYNQNTGLTDKYGNIIHEGDVVDFICSTEWSLSCMAKGCFVVTFEQDVIYLSKIRNKKVIGNIHSNPELVLEL